MWTTKLLFPYAESLVNQLVAADLLTRRQAEIYVLRRVIGASRSKTAEYLGVTKSRVDQALRAASEKIEAARATMDLIDRAGMSVEIEAIQPDLGVLAERLGLREELAEEIAGLYCRAAEGEIRRAFDEDEASLEICQDTARGDVGLLELTRDHWLSSARLVDQDIGASELLRVTREALDSVWSPCGDHGGNPIYRAEIHVSFLTDAESET